MLVALFPRWNLAWLSPVALVPLLMALGRERRAGRRFLLGAVTGWIFWAGTCYWIYGVLYRHGRMPAAGAAALFVGFFLLKGLHLGVFAWVAGWSLARAWAVPAVAAAWVAVEGTHPYAGFTWLMLGNAATDMALVARLAPLTGVAGMSFALAMMSVGLTLALGRRPRAQLAWLLALPLLYLAPPLPLPSPGRQLAHLVQPNISEEEVYSLPWTPLRHQRMLRLWETLSTSQRSPDLLLWPENPAPSYYDIDPLFRATVEQIARTQGTFLLFSSITYRDRETRRQPLNSAVLVGPEGNEMARYDKIYLVPFGEFVPWPLGALVQKVTREAGDFVPGDRVVVASAGERRIGTFICYESVYGRGVRRFAAGGAEVLVNLSNDGWFGRSAARQQHLLIARMRAAENGRWLLRATNSGLTAVIDPAGRVRAALEPDRAGVLAGGFDYSGARTFYTRWGDWFWWTAVAGALLSYRGRTS